MSRSKNVAFVPRYSSFTSNYPGYIHLKDFENSSSSMNRLVAWYLSAAVDFLEIRF